MGVCRPTRILDAHHRVLSRGAALNQFGCGLVSLRRRTALVMPHPSDQEFCLSRNFGRLRFRDLNSEERGYPNIRQCANMSNLRRSLHPGASVSPGRTELPTGCTFQELTLNSWGGESRVLAIFKPISGNSEDSGRGSFPGDTGGGGQRHRREIDGPCLSEYPSLSMRWRWCPSKRMESGSEWRELRCGPARSALFTYD